MEPENKAPPSRRETLVPALSVVAVALVAVAAAVMVQRTETKLQHEAAVDTRPALASTSPVVKAPPLQPSTHAMGGAAACKQCGVVEMVVAVFDPGRKEPRAYQMHVRMDDGTLRTVEQRGALAAGSRVTVDGNSIKPM